jgi:hypothetical protein
MSIDTKGGEPPFAAGCTKASYAQEVTFAKFHLFPESSLSCGVQRKLAVSPKRKCKIRAACARRMRLVAQLLVLHLQCAEDSCHSQPPQKD